MDITAAMVKELREATGAGVMACKKALVETDGNQEEAIEVLRKNGEATAVKKSGRIAAEGVVATLVEDGKAAIVEVNSETDFVAKNDKFQTFVSAVAKQIIDSDAADVDALLAEAWNADTSKTVKDELVSQIAVIGENMNIRRFEKLESDGVIVSYIHAGGKIGVLVEADAPKSDAVEEALKNVAMQVAAMNAKFVSEDEIDDDYIAHEEEILKAQIMNDPKESQKPEKVIEGMIKGRIKKQFKEVCLMDQVYVKAEDGKQSVEKYLEQVGNEAGGTITVKKFVRFETGEGLEKKEEDFAAEVAAQMN
ncbi:MAG: elongation factor Ts [Eubacterium sp.]|nr:elongation factor Ts [Eubacterium sp.]